MKPLTIFTRIIILALVLITPVVGGQGLRKSHHDFGGNAWNGEEICKPCHTPKAEGANPSEVPGWAAKTATNGFETFTFSSMDGNPSGNTKLCLSCHDGTIAPIHGGNTINTFKTTVGYKSDEVIKDHPVSISYSAAQAHHRVTLHDPATTLSGLGSTIEKDMLQNGKVECTSCHDIHLSRNLEGCASCHPGGTGKATQSVSLWKGNTFSALCLTCHNK